MTMYLPKIIALFATLAIATGLVTALSMSEIPLAAGEGAGGGCGVGGCGGPLIIGPHEGSGITGGFGFGTGFGEGGFAFGGGGGDGDLHCGEGGGGASSVGGGGYGGNIGRC